MDDTARAAAKQRAWAEIERRRDEAIGLFADLVRIPSPNPPGGGEKDVARYCKAYLEALGAEVTQHEFQEGRTQNVALLRGRTGGKTLLFVSHLDTTPITEEGWTYPPLSATIVDGWLYGRGSNNMKVGLAAAMFAQRVIRDLGIPLEGNVASVHSADEMNGGWVGLGELAKRGLVEADYAIYTEAHPRFPALRIEIAVRGTIEIKLRTGGHGTVFGAVRVNAIEKMAGVLLRLAAMEFPDWKPKDWQPDPIGKIPPTVSTSYIHAWRGHVLAPDRCDAIVAISYFPPQTLEPILAEVGKVIDELRAADPELDIDWELDRHWEQASTSPDDLISQASQRAIEEATGQRLEFGASTAPSDMRWVANTAGIPTAKVCFGSETADVDERQNLDDYIRTIKVYATLILDLT
jgi:acetylornithine deacetylase/succinyl-diaminopimelate desuccinylase-like protein